MISSSQIPEIRLFLITRKVREGVPRTRPNVFKYVYQAYTVQITEQIQAYIRDRLGLQLSKLRELGLEEYRVIDDDEPRALLFDVAGKEFSFLKLIREQLPRVAGLPPVVDFRELEGDTWAYIFSFHSEDGVVAYSLNKLSDTKIALDERDNAPLLSARRFMAQFNPRDRRLEFLTSPTISLNGEAAAYYTDDRFYILNKPQFTQIAGVEEDFAATAVAAINSVAQSNLVDGLELAHTELGRSRRLLRRLANLTQIEGLSEVTPERIERMRAIAQQHGLQLKVEAGRIKLENTKDLDLFVKMLEDYFLRSPQTGYDYGSRAKRRLKTPRA
jgi:hypothetical protein